MAELRYRLFDHAVESVEPIVALFAAVHGDASAFRGRWPWEFLAQPEPRGARIYVAEAAGRLVGMTARMPCTVKLDGELRQACFATNSMVLPEYRGRGIIRNLYGVAVDDCGLQLSRATLPAMRAVIRKMGYRDVGPSKFQVCVLRPLALAASKVLGVWRPRASEGESAGVLGEFARVSRFDAELDRMDHPLTAGFRDGVVKTASFLNWRYFDIPHRRYHVFLRRRGGVAVSVVVLRFDGPAAQLVDIRWAAEAADEPATAVEFAKAYSHASGMLTLALWSNGAVLRREVRRKWFIERRRHAMLSCYSPDSAVLQMACQRLQFVNGDGDKEYL